MQAYERQHREAVRTAALNARLNTLHEEDPPFPVAPTTDAAALSDVDVQDQAPKKHKDKKSKSRKRDRRKRDEDADGDDDTAARLQKNRGKQQWELDEEQFDEECVAHPCGEPELVDTAALWYPAAVRFPAIHTKQA